MVRNNSTALYAEEDGIEEGIVPSHVNTSRS